MSSAGGGDDVSSAERCHAVTEVDITMTFEKLHKTSNIVIPAEAGIQNYQRFPGYRHSCPLGIRRYDDFTTPKNIHPRRFTRHLPAGDRASQEKEVG